MADWTVVIPVKGTVSAKSRLGASPELALAIALDSVAAALSAFPGVIPLPEPTPLPEPVEGHVIVVTSASMAPQFAALGARTILDAGAGLNAAITQGIAAAPTGPVAVLLGDVPGLRPSELAAALELAAAHPLAFVPDADGDGTVLVAALDAADHRPAFGLHSRAAHRAAGYAELDIPAESGLRRDVDTPAQLAALGDRLGPRTRATLA